MSLRESVHAAIEAAIAERLTRPGLFPALAPGVEGEALEDGRVRLAGGGHAVDVPSALVDVLENPAGLAAHAFHDWPGLLRELWTLGLVYLRDEASIVHPSTVFHFALRVVVERSTIGPFSVLKHGPLLLHEAYLEGHAVLVGPLQLDDTGVGHHTYAGTVARIRRSFLGPFVKVQVGVDVDAALIASHCSIDGGHHLDFMPLAPADVAAEGVRIGPQSWIGQQASLTAGALLGRGVIVATGTALGKAVGDHRFIAGAPPREFPIDWHVRGLDPAAARAAGRAQGATAAMLPLFGTPRVRHRGAALELEYGYDAGGPLADFHAGALEALFARLVPDVPAVVTREGSHFHIAFERALERYVAFDPDLECGGKAAALAGPPEPHQSTSQSGGFAAALQMRIAEALPSTVGTLVERALRERWLDGSIADTADLIVRELTAMAGDGLLDVRFSLPVPDAWCRKNIAPIEAALAGIDQPEQAPEPSPEQSIVEFLHGRGLTDVEAETPLLSSGRIDSFALAALLTELEERFGIVIDLDEVTPADFDRPSDIAALVERRRSG